MNEVPREIFRIIQQYLNKYDYRQLLNTSLGIFQHVKYETVYYNILLDCQEVNIKTVEEQRRVRDDLSHLYGSVKDKNKQISLRLSSFVEECISLMSGIHKLDFRDISYFSRDNPINIRLFCNIYYLDLICVNNIDHLSGLRDIKVLHLTYCRSIRKIAFIPGLKKLLIRSLTALLEISEYGSIPELHISDCPELNFHGLGNHKRFSFAGRNPIISDIDLSVFQKTQHLEISADYQQLKGLDTVLPSFPNLILLNLGCSNKYFNVSTFPNLRQLKLIQAKINSEILFPSTLQIGEFKECVFDDLIVLSKIKELRFYHCKGREFKNIHSLSNAYKLVFCDIKHLQNVNSLDRVHDLSLFSCYKVKDISKLGRVHHLSIVYCEVTSLEGLGQGNSRISLSLPSLPDFSQLKFVSNVTLENCDGLVDGRGLSEVKILTVHGCNNLTDTSSFEKVKRLTLVSCNKIRRLTGLENVPYIHVEGCHAVEDIDCLGKQQSLIILNCSTLQQLMKNDHSGRYERLFQGIIFLRIFDSKFSWSRSNFLPLRTFSSKIPYNFNS